MKKLKLANIYWTSWTETQSLKIKRLPGDLLGPVLMALSGHCWYKTDSDLLWFYTQPSWPRKDIYLPAVPVWNVTCFCFQVMALLGICDAMFGCMFRQWGSNYRMYLWPQPGQKWVTCGSDKDGNHICLFSYTGFLSLWLISSSVYIFCIFGFWVTFWILKQVSPLLISVWESHTLTCLGNQGRELGTF